MRNLTLLPFVLLVAATCRNKGKIEATPPDLGAPPPAVSAPVETPSQQMARNFARVNFAYDSATLDADAKAALAANATIMRENPSITVEVQGHCDERGSTEYNIALGNRRAAAVRAQLIAEGVAPSRISTVSYGEERPLANSETDVAWAENRRAEFRITDGDSPLVVGTVN